MKKYKFFITEFSQIDNNKPPEKKTIIFYKCLICNYTHEYSDDWTDEKKAEVKEFVDTHYNDHIIED